MMIKLSDYIFKFLEKNNMNNVFMLSGGSSMHLGNSLGQSKNIKYIACHHEQSCAMAAEAYAKFKNSPGVVLVTSGPGSTNTLTGVAGAFLDSTPCFVISGQSKRMQTVYNSKIENLRQFGVQEVNILPMVSSITKYAVTVTEPEKIRYHLEKALHLAVSGRPGPVWIDVPLDVQNMQINENELEGFMADESQFDYKENPEEEDIHELVEALKVAQRPMIIAGHGIRLADAINELREYIETYKIPIVTPFMGIDIIESDSPNYIGRIGTKGTRAGNIAMQNADLILSIGSRLSVSSVGHEYKLFARDAKIVVVDIDKDEHSKKTIKIDKFINADAKCFMNTLIESTPVEFEAKQVWLNQCNEWKQKYPVCLPEYSDVEDGINYYYFVDQLTRKLSADVPVISDAGSSFYVVSQALNLKKNQRYITSGAFATMGFNLPAAIGVSVANDNKEVVTITGEGSFQQNIQELQTIVHNRLPVKTFVVNNNGYYSIRQTQKRYFKGNFVGEGTESGVSFPSTEKIANAYGMKYFKASTNEELETVLKDVIEYDGAVVCEIMSIENQEIIPTVSSAVNKKGVMVSKPLEDMYPFLDRDEFKNTMIVKPVD